MFRENDTGVVLVNADGQEVAIQCRAGEEVELPKPGGGRGETLTLESLQVQFPSVLTFLQRQCATSHRQWKSLL